jgi:hypothetical protein
MIREALGIAYNRTVGALKDWLLGLVSSLTRGGGLIQALYVIFTVALMAGFINAAVFPVTNQSYIPYPNGTAMTIPEAIINAFAIAVGGAGIYLTYLSGRQTTRSRTVNLYLGLALLLILTSVFIGIDMLQLKGL